MNNEISLQKSELQAVLLLAFIFSLRVLGLFMILPVFARFAGVEYSNASPSLIGIAVGIYGLAQALLQIPLGFLSDYLGRKKVIYVGLSLFILGSCIAMLAVNVYWVILGRLLQGSGAIGCVLLASAADATRENVRIKAMGIIGISIGGSFILAILLGPILHAYIKLSGIFFFTALLGVLALVLTRFSAQISYITTPKQKIFAKRGGVFTANLLSVYGGVFLLHAILAMLFLILPKQIDMMRRFDVYFIAIILASVIIALLVIQYLIRLQTEARILLACAVSVFISIVILFGLERSLSTVFVSLLMFFSSFNIIEATLPALVAKYTPADKKGMAMGIFSSSQFFGIFVGGLIGGFFFNQ